MKTYKTEFVAEHRLTGELVLFAGPDIEAESQQEAQDWADHNIGYLRVVGEKKTNMAMLAEMIINGAWPTEN